MKAPIFLAAIFIMMATYSTQAQNSLHIATGSVVTVQPGSTLFVNGGVNLENNSTLNVAGTMTINRAGATSANFTDNAVTPHSYGTGKFIFTGPGGSQNIRGYIFNDLEINNDAGVVMLNDQTVNNNLSLINGSLSLGGNTLSLNGTVTGTGKLKGSSTSKLVIGSAAGTLYFDQTDSASRSLKDITFNNGSATLGNAMQVYGILGLTSSTFHLNNQSLVLKSIGIGSSNTARVGNLTGSTLDGATNVTVERYIASPQRAWHLLGAKAVTGSQTIKQAWQENGAAITGLGTLITSNLYNAGNGFDALSNSSSILPHNQGGVNGPSWNYTLPNTNNIVISSYPGFMLFVRGDRNYTTANGPATSPTVLRTTGLLTQGNQSAFISSTGAGRTLVANPFASPIDMETVFTGTTNIAQDMYVWNPAATGNYGVGAFELVQRTVGGTYQVTPFGGNPAADATSRYIHSGQAFFLRTIGTAGLTDATVIFTENMKTSAVSIIDPIVTAPGDQQIYANLMIVQPGNTASLADGIRIRFDSSYSSGTSDDILKISNFAENLSSFRESKKLIVENRPMIVSKDTIFLRMTNLGIKNYRFAIGSLDFVQPYVTAYLQDIFLNTNRSLDLTGNVNYVDFSITTDPASANQDRFRIVFALSSPLPVTITNIKAAQQANNIAVEWKVSNQVNIQKYEVEKSFNGTTFAKTFTQPVIGINGSDGTYNWLDINPPIGDNFYRIRCIGIGGDEKISQIVKVTLMKGNSEITVYPNPVINKLIYLKFADMIKGGYQVRLVNSIGQIIFEKQLLHAGGNGLQTIDLANISRGSYQLEIKGPNNSKTTKGLIVAD